MVRRSLIAAALLAATTPLAAQTPPTDPVAWSWTANRPDANAPLGVFGARTFEDGEIVLSYRFSQMNSRGVWFGSDSLDLATTLQLYDDAPLTLSDVRHQVSLGVGVSENLTFIARGEFAVLERETIANSNLLRVGVEEIGDVEVGLLYNVYREGPYRLHIQGGAIIPTGSARTFADTTAAGGGATVALPFDMRPKGGTVGAILGLTGTTQNEVASLGAQFRARINLHSRNGYRLGNRYEANGWAAYKVSQSISVSWGARWANWGNITGVDRRLDQGGDPHNVGNALAGQLAMMPIGLNFVMPPESPFAGHRLSLEAVYALHRDYESPQLGLDWGLHFGWSVAF